MVFSIKSTDLIADLYGVILLHTVYKYQFQMNYSSKCEMKIIVLCGKNIRKYLYNLEENKRFLK